MSEYNWKPLSPDKADWVYTNSSQDEARGCVGHIRGDFGSGNEFWTTWWPHLPRLVIVCFKEELDSVINSMREKGGVLSNLADMRQYCHESGNECRLKNTDNSYGFQMETDRYMYFLRCFPQKGDYNFYLYVSDKEAIREHELTCKTCKTAEKPKEVRHKLHGDMER